MKNFLLLAVLFCASCATEETSPPGESGPGQSLVVRSEEAPLRLVIVPPAEPVGFGEAFPLKIRVEFGEGVEDRFDYLPAEFFKPLEWVETPRSELRFVGDGRFKWAREFVYVLVGNFSGNVEIPPFLVDYRLLDEKPANDLAEWKSRDFRSESFNVELRELPGDVPENLIPGPGFVLGNPFLLPLGLGGAGALSFLALAALSRWRRMGQALGEGRETEEIDHRAVAFEALLALENRYDFALPEHVREFHVKLSGALRSFIENCLNEKAEELTTEEFMQNLLDNPRFTEKQKTLLRGYLSLSDSVKFAHFLPDAGINHEMLAKVRDFVNVSGATGEA